MDVTVSVREMGYDEITRNIKITMRRSAKNAVQLGYMLRRVQEGRIWEGRHGSFREYLEKELGMEYTLATRFISMNKKYSWDGNSMDIKPEYEEYSQGLLVEMLTMPPELEGEVRPGMTVQEARDIKRGARQEALGQQAAPEEAGGAAEGPETAAGWTENVMNGPESVTEEPESVTEEPETVTENPDGAVGGECREEEAAGPQPVDRAAGQESTCPPGIGQCIREEWGWTAAEQEAGAEECRKCWDGWKRTERVLRGMETEGDGRETGDDGGRTGEIEMSQDGQQGSQPAGRGTVADAGQWPKKCITGQSPYGACPCCGFEGAQCCSQCRLDCNGRCGWAVDPRKGGDAGADAGGEPSPAEVLRAAKELLAEERALLDGYIEAGDIPGRTVLWQRVKIDALEAMAGRLEAWDGMSGQPGMPAQPGTPEQPEAQPQPELPVLKNNDRRKEWLKGYREWGLWYHDGNIDVNYYKYDFEDGSRLVVAEYLQREEYWSGTPADSHFYHLLEKGREGYGGRRFDQKYVQATDSEGCVVEFLKKLQKR